MIKTYQYKPQFIEAVQLTEDNFADILLWLPVDVVLRFNWKERSICIENWVGCVKDLRIGDWVIKYLAVHGGYDTFDDDSFNRTFMEKDKV